MLATAICKGDPAALDILDQAPHLLDARLRRPPPAAQMAPMALAASKGHWTMVHGMLEPQHGQRHGPERARLRYSAQSKAR